MLCIVILSTIIILFIVLYYINDSIFNIEGFSQVGREENENESIFVSIPSYRDIDCKGTLKSLFENAKHPELIYVGVFEQNDNSCPEEKCHCPPAYQNQMRYKYVHYSEAKGPFYARAVINNNLYRGEKYYMMIDAHTLFLKHWDVRMKDQLHYLSQQGIQKPIISSYPHHQDFDKSKEIIDEKRNVTTLICDIINAKEYPTEALALEKPSGHFYKSLLLGAGFLFTYGEFFKEIRLDENIQHIFSGEEILLAILAYTHGWDIYTPAYLNVFHYYNHKKPSWFTDVLQNQKKREREIESYKKLKYILDRDENHVTMGKVRHIAHFWKELGFNRRGNNLQDKYPAVSKEFRCNNTPKVKYPITEQFMNYNHFNI